MARTFDIELERSSKVIKLKLHQLCAVYGEQDIADWARCSVHMVQKYRNVNEEKYQMPAANLRLLSKRISTLHDSTLIKDFTDSTQCVLLSPPGIANGCVDDDLKELLKAAGEAACCFDAQDKHGYEQAMKDLKQVLKNMKAEGQGLQ